MRSRNSRSSSIDLANPVERSHPLNRGKVAWYLALPGLMGGAKAPNLTDLPGDFSRGSHGTLIAGPAWSRGTDRPGGFGHLIFDGATGQRVNLGDRPFLPGLSALTLSIWFRTTSSAAIFLLGEAWSVANHLDLSGGQVRFGINANISQYTSSGVGYNDGIWHQAVGTYDGSYQVLYVDGLEVSRASQSGPVVNPNGRPAIGAYRSDGESSSNHFVGDMDDAWICARALLTSEIRAGYGLSRRNYPGMLRRIGPRVAVFDMGGAFRPYFRRPSAIIGSGVH